MVLLGAYAGLRFGEASALRIPHLRLLERRIEISEGASEVNGKLYVGPLKTKESRRVVAIPAFLADELAHGIRTRTDKVREPEHLLDLVFPAPEGGHLRRRSFGHRFWAPAVERAGISPAPTFHHLRHTAAALAIAEGRIRRRSRPGWATPSITTTLNTYGHLFPRSMSSSPNDSTAFGCGLAARLRHAEVVKIRSADPTTR